ncbi:MAG: ATP-binding protein [Vicinamibacterales bacterium]
MMHPGDGDARASFPSFAALRTAHTDLLRLYRGAGGSPTLLDQAEAFICAGAATGAVLDDDEERMGAQSLLDYWSAILSRAERPPSSAFLEPFNPEMAPALPDSACPYVGLEAFGESKKRLFFGREQVVRDVLALLPHRRFLAVVGPLGSGKSSLVLGAIIPALKAGKLPGSAACRFYPPFTPGAEPLDALARAVGATAQAGSAGLQPEDIVRAVDGGGEQPAVIVADRLEEIFTRCASSDARDAFAAALVALSESPNRHLVIVTLRSDFEAQIAAVPPLHARFGDAAFRVPPLSAAELRDVICRPAEQVGLKFEPGLVDRLVKETLGEPAGLPLLQFSLLKLWDLRDHNRLTLDAYRRIGGGRRALAAAADELYESLDQKGREALRVLLLRMVRPVIGGEIVTVAVHPRAAYDAADPVSVDDVVSRLVSARLARMVSGEDGGEQLIELAHGALVWNWPRLVEWLDEERMASRRRLRLTSAAEQWHQHGRDPGGLLGGSLLEEAQSYGDLSPLEQALVAASTEAAKAAEEEEDRRRNRELEQTLALVELERRRADEQGQAAQALKMRNRSLVTLIGAVVVLLFIAIAGWILAERKQQTVEALIAGRGVVVETPTLPASSDAAAEAPVPVGAAPAPAAPAPAARPPLEARRPPVSVAPPAVAFAAPPDVLQRVRLRASRRPVGRQITGTELPAYAFSLWVDGPADALQAIDEVSWEFNHPTFRQKVQVGRDRNAGFRVGYTGWGCLSVVAVTLHVRGAVDPPHVDFNMCASLEEIAE